MANWALSAEEIARRDAYFARLKAYQDKIHERNRMKLNDIAVLVYHAQGNKVVPHHLKDKDGREGYNHLVQNGLIEEIHDEGIEMFRLTERGRVFSQALMSVPLPINAWTMPGKE